jgi:two-component system sensor histidine kinase YesM
MSSIKNRLLFYFISIICLLLIPLVCLLINYSIQARYRHALETISVEYQTSDSLNNLIALFNSLLKNTQDNKIIAAYSTEKENVNAVASNLSRSTSHQDLAKRIGSTVSFVVEYCDKAIESTKKGDFSQTTEMLEQIRRGNSSVKQDTSDLIFSELESSLAEQRMLQTIVKISWIIASLIILAVISVSIYLAITWSNKLTRPLVKLSNTATDITKGQLQSNVDKELLDMQDEIGSLSSSFNLMVSRLRNQITELDSSNKALEQSKKDIEHQSSRLKQMNELMTGREIKMIELKKEIESLKQQILSAKPT